MKNIIEQYRNNLIKIHRCKNIVRLKALQEEQKRIKPKVEQYINCVDDPVMYLILYERILHGRSWQSVACILGGGNTADCVRMQYKRYFKSENQN